MMKFINLLLVFLVITINTYSQQEKKSRNCPIYLSKGGYMPVYYTDSVIVDGVIVYTDSITTRIVSVDYTDSVIIDGSVIYTDSNVSYETNYPFSLTGDNLPFKKAIYLNDHCGYSHLMLIISATLCGESESDKSEKEKKYYLLSLDNRYIKYAFFTKVDNSELYAEYYPKNEDNNGTVSFSIIPKKKLDYWVQQEMNKGLMVSIGGRNRRTFICKSFEYKL